MRKLKVQDIHGKAVGEIDFSEDLLVVDKGEQAVRDVVVAIMAGQRAGTASTLSKGEVAGSNAKPWKQKGTGRARAGYRQSPVWRGGGVAFGPHPRSYAKKINKKVARLAFMRAFSDTITEDRLVLVDELALAEGKTKVFAEILKELKLTGSTIFIVDKIEEKVVRACRNIPKVEMDTAANLSVYQLLRYRNVVVTKPAMDVIKARFCEVEAEKAVEPQVVEKGK